LEIVGNLVVGDRVDVGYFEREEELDLTVGEGVGLLTVGKADDGDADGLDDEDGIAVGLATGLEVGLELEL